MIWIDLLEAETSYEFVPSNMNDYYDVTDAIYGAVPNDGLDDLNSIQNCIDAAEANGKGGYIPAGKFHVSSRLKAGGVDIQGAGIWHTELRFTTQAGGTKTVGF